MKKSNPGDPVGDRPKVSKVEVVVETPEPLSTQTRIKFTCTNPGNLNLPITIEFANSDPHVVSGTRSQDGNVVEFLSDGRALDNPIAAVINHSSILIDTAEFVYTDRIPPE